MHISMLRWCVNKVICIIHIIEKQTSLQICISMSKYLSFVYYQGHFKLEYKCMYFSLNIFMFEYKCMHVFSKNKCNFKYKCMHAYARGYGNEKQTSPFCYL